MPSGKTSKLVHFYSKKKLVYLAYLWATLIISIGVVGILFIFKVPELVLAIVAFILLIITFLMIIYCKSKLSYFDMMHRYQLLLDSSKGLEKTNCKFDSTWILDLQRKGLSLFSDETNFSIYYKINDSLAKKTLVKTRVIEIVTIIKNNKIDLFANEIEAVYKKLWLKHEKQYHLNKQVIIQFAKYQSFDDSIKTDLNRIISFKDKDNYLIQINCGYFSNSQSVYYLHSDVYAPNAYYKYAVDEIKEILNLSK